MTEHTPTPTSPMRSDSADEAEIAGLRKERKDGHRREHDALNRVVVVSEENATLRERLAAVEAERDKLKADVA